MFESLIVRHAVTTCSANASLQQRVYQQHDVLSLVFGTPFARWVCFWDRSVIASLTFQRAHWVCVLVLRLVIRGDMW